MSIPSHRIHGTKTPSVMILHGGPGAPGQIKPVAEFLGKYFGVLEPLLLQTSIKGQIDELVRLQRNTESTIKIVVGHSWGAILGYLYISQFPDKIKLLVMISSGVFDKEYADRIMQTRMKRLSEDERDEVRQLLMRINALDHPIHKLELDRFERLMTQADSVNLLDEKNPTLLLDPKVFNSVWSEFTMMRADGQLLEAGKKISCPVVVIHGDYDSHPIDGIVNPLKTVIEDLDCRIFENCGHYPWLEKEVRENFFEYLRSVIRSHL